MCINMCILFYNKNIRSFFLIFEEKINKVKLNESCLNLCVCIYVFNFIIIFNFVVYNCEGWFR